MQISVIDDRSRPCKGAGQVLIQYRTQLEWLAYFLTGDQRWMCSAAVPRDLRHGTAPIPGCSTAAGHQPNRSGSGLLRRPLRVKHSAMGTVHGINRKSSRVPMIARFPKLQPMAERHQKCLAALNSTNDIR